MARNGLSGALTPGRASPGATAMVALAALLIAGCGDDAADPLGPASPSSARVTPGATFDWSMPARFGFDEDGDGLLDYPRAAEQIRPAAWTVAFDACGIAADRYTWYVDRHPVARVETCTYEHRFAAEGGYDVAVHAVSTPGASVWAEERVTVQDWLIVSFGDSYASGEGVPEVPRASQALVRRVEALLRDLQEAQRQRELARSSLAEALERKGLAEDILENARQRRQAFLNACTIDEFTDIQQCAEFLAARALSFELYNDAKAHFDQAVQNANERLTDAIAAVEAARAAVAAAQNAIDNLRGAIEAARGEFEEPRWQAGFAPETWDHPACHRSANAAPARAALALEAADPRTSVTFVHLACSGAQMEGGRAPVEEQIRWADQLIGDREIDAVLLSIGGNDAGFADLAFGCAVQEPCFVDD
ncbi:MAG: hypothetical protein GWM90_19420, partial [Gemmatimonadetes bacterium]|nr:hypothetical protein [Gemmatimonadota bacterium]NIQ56589.1 hypothetical protein [Gemmatimonadota bacterium]NIU76791.1 hypothetical protein [Gammaproteobacteria bacterium]NIX46176.1 hypothetical protein [Gemmatimonadota bacterium]NIY10501.1 hypothetical protein [Gemmatimonadota bacterium]